MKSIMRLKFTATVLAAVLLVACGTPAASVPQSPSSTPASVPATQPPESTPPLPSPATSDVQASSAAPVASSATAPQAWWQEGLAVGKFVFPSDPNSPSCGDTSSKYYYYDDAGKLSYSADVVFQKNDSYSPDPLLATAKEATDIGARILADRFFEMVALDDTKYTGEFYEKGIKLIRSLPGGDKGESVLLALEATAYQSLRDAFEGCITATAWKRPAWLTMLRPSRLVSTTVTDTTGGTKSSRADENGVLPAETTWLLDDLLFNAKGAGTATTLAALPQSAHVALEFNNGLVYNLYYTETQALITASDVFSGFLYEFSRSSPLRTIEAYAAGRVNPRTGKPVIYLYPTAKTDCTVTVDYDRFTYTYPAYNNGWQVTAYPDGRLVNKADGSEHYYLFWEGNKRIDWEFASGFVVAGKETESFLREKLAYMGLTPREYNDFITYWVPRMQDAPYNLITFAGEQYEQLAPLTVTPTPDSILRVHMVYRPLQKPVEIPQQTLSTVTRRGFTVVEWGGTTAH